MGRKKKYTPKALEKAVEKYFRDISRTVAVTEAVDSGRRDDKGHVIYDYAPVKNDDGKAITRREYLLPPTVGGLCERLGISRDTWSSYCTDAAYAAAAAAARGRLQAWNEEELVTRKDVKGIIFNLQNNYGYAEKHEIRGSIEDFLQKQDGGVEL